MKSALATLSGRSGGKRIAVIELMAFPDARAVARAYNLLLTKQYASIMPQSVSAWCRALGHRVTYATYYGIGDPLALLPSDAEWVFLSCYTQISPIAYVLAKAARARGAVVVLGGPHAKAFPLDALRFVDYAVGECDEMLLRGLLAGEYRPGTAVASAEPPSAFPLVRERLPEIEAASTFGGWRSPTTTVALLASTGCPYDCSFCIDWKSKYRTTPADRLDKDLRFIARHMPRALVAFHDPNFAIRFDDTLSTLEGLERCPPYMMESSLSVLKPERVARLGKTNCVFVAPGIESWDDFSNKSRGASKRGLVKLKSVVEQFSALHEHVPGLQANFIFGLDTDDGAEPIDLLKTFMDEAPFVWPTMNIPVPFGGTPLFDERRAAGRVLEEMPFRFYYAPYTVTKIKNYGPLAYYRNLIALFEYCSSASMIRRRLTACRSWTETAVVLARSVSVRAEVKQYRRLLRALEEDSELRTFHEQGGRLPDFYRREYSRGLGPLADALSDEERRPVLDQVEMEKAA